MVLLLLTFCSLLLPLWESVSVQSFVVRYFMSILVVQSSWWGRESWLLCLICLPGVSWWLSGSSSRCHGVVCGLWLWYFLIIFTIFGKWLTSWLSFVVSYCEFVTFSMVSWIRCGTWLYRFLIFVPLPILIFLCKSYGNCCTTKDYLTLGWPYK